MNTGSEPTPPPTVIHPPPFKDTVNGLRADINETANSVRSLMRQDYFSFPQAHPVPGADLGEMKANIMLAYRALEDARMRLGKCLQAQEGGVSCFDKPA